MKPNPVAFITGIAGFAGSHLAEELLRKNFSVHGSILVGESTANLREIRKAVSLVKLDIRNASRCRQITSRINPDYVFHLAALSSVGRSFSAEQKTFSINLDGTCNMLEAARSCRRLKKFLFVSSADCYGNFSPKNQLLKESSPLNPISPYGISKMAAERISVYYHKMYDLPVTIARSFNHTGPRQAEQFVVPAFASQIAAVEAGKQKAILKVGDLSARRDLSDVRDIVRGYCALAVNGEPGEVYQLCSGRVVSIQNILNRLVALSGKKIKVVQDKSRLRKADIPILKGSYQKATRRVGYQPEIKLTKTLDDTLNYWRGIVETNTKR